MRSANGVDPSIQARGELGPDEVAELHRLFGAAYREPDHSFLERRLASLPEVATAWSGDDMVGFVAAALSEMELSCVGRRSVTDGGITCIDPAAQGTGIANALVNEILRSRGGRVSELAVHHFATPVTLHAMFRLGKYHWPGNDITEVAAALAAPTARQPLVGAALAQHAGAISYDADYWVIRTGQPIAGTAVVAEGVDVKTAQFRLGHADPKITLRVYVQATEQADRDAAQKVGDRLRPPVDGETEPADRGSAPSQRGA